MLMTIDAGNTQTVIGLFDERSDGGEGAAVGMVDHWRIATHHDRTSDEYAALLRNLLAAAEIDLELNLVAEGDRACAGQQVVHLVVARMNVRRSFGDPDDVDIGDTTFTASHDSLNLAEWTIDGCGLVTVMDEWLFHSSSCLANSSGPIRFVPTASSSIHNFWACGSSPGPK